MPIKIRALRWPSVFLLLFFASNYLCDIFMTNALVGGIFRHGNGDYGMIIEGNPIVAWVMAEIGIWWIGVRLGLLAFFLAVFYRLLLSQSRITYIVLSTLGIFFFIVNLRSFYHMYLIAGGN